MESVSISEANDTCIERWNAMSCGSVEAARRVVVSAADCNEVVKSENVPGEIESDAAAAAAFILAMYSRWQ